MAGGNWLSFSLDGGFHQGMVYDTLSLVIGDLFWPVGIGCTLVWSVDSTQGCFRCGRRSLWMGRWCLFGPYFFFGGRSQSVGIEYLLGKIVEGGFEVVCGSFFPFCSLLLSNWATTL